MNKKILLLICSLIISTRLTVTMISTNAYFERIAKLEKHLKYLETQPTNKAVLIEIQKTRHHIERLSKKLPPANITVYDSRFPGPINLTENNVVGRFQMTPEF